MIWFSILIWATVAIVVILPVISKFSGDGKLTDFLVGLCLSAPFLFIALILG
ncbi:hypothetical protein [Acinetobacter sp. GWC1_38_13]|uniref:hypothetical protein n=1 Tax=Acinetobacter sp. GWC1_38_13 TaxID=1797234 RepID=UPI002580F781|nr:hypothetical protein [Acinetobacter sp. GWC1_38_13]